MKKKIIYLCSVFSAVACFSTPAIAAVDTCPGTEILELNQRQGRAAQISSPVVDKLDGVLNSPRYRTKNTHQARRVQNQNRVRRGDIQASLCASNKAIGLNFELRF